MTLNRADKHPVKSMPEEVLGDKLHDTISLLEGNELANEVSWAENLTQLVTNLGCRA